MKRSRSSRYSDRSDYKDDEAAPSLSSPPPMREDGYQYDVFLSFRGPDTRKGFTSHLYHALQDKGIPTFIDSEQLEKGQKVKELFGYIERSKIFVPIFSKGYADSEWCLKEITKMVECKRLIIPVFFDVEPRDVRGQSDLFEPAFTRYDENDDSNKDEVRKWRNALIEAGEVSGYTLANTCVSEARLIKLIMKRILTEVNKTPLFVAKHRVGLDSRAAELVEMLKVQAQNDVKMVGIHGMGGIGKTTLARAVYNQIYPHFDAYSFISDVREAAKQSKLVSLQEQLLRHVFKDEKVKVNDTAHGTGMIMGLIKSKKVLLVLDDIDSEPQLSALAGSVDWFHSGSRIVITTRNKQVLIGPLRVENMYELKVLNDIQSLQLFCWHAFGKEEPKAEIAELSKKVADAAAGLPLALEIFGSHFFCLETNKEREDMLKKLKKDQDEVIHERLKISFDALGEKEKTVFLDIACFFIGKDRDFATFKWKDIFPDLTIKFLMLKSLMNINEYTGQFEMHDHIRDMGRKIVEDESRSDPRMRSRLWKKDDLLYVLQNKRGTEKIEAIDISCLSQDSVDVDAESFAGMSRLRMLRLGNVRLRGEYGHFPRTLKWLKWNPLYLDMLPSSLPLENIVVLDLSGSSITQVWNNHGFRETKVFGQLKVLNLSSCWNLTFCPDFMAMEHLEILDLVGCGNMTELHPSIGYLKSLTRLNLRWCSSLKELPKEVWQLTSLEELDVRNCSQITALPSHLMDSNSLKWPLLGKLKVMNIHSFDNLTICPDFTCMPHLKKLDFHGCEKLTELHPSIGHLKSLAYLSLRGCKSLKELPEGVWQLTSLEELDVSKCSQITTLSSQLLDSKSLKRPLLGLLKVMDFNSCKNLTICPDFTCMPYIEKLDLSGCEKLIELHPSIGHLKSLTHLSLRGCESLKELLEGLTSEEPDVSKCFQITTLSSQLLDSRSLKGLLLGKLKVMNLDSCKKLTVCPDFSCIPCIEYLDFTGCEKLAELHPSIGHLKSLTHLSLNECKSLKALPKELWQLTSIKMLVLSDCYQITTFPLFWDSKSLEHVLPQQFSRLTSQKELQLSLCSQFANSILQSVDSLSLKQPLLDKVYVLRLDNCANLLMCPDFKFMPHIENLNFAGCEKLTELHPSIGHLKSLTHLNLSWCSSLKELPKEAWQLTSLENLDLRYCCKVATLPSQLGNSERLKQLFLDGTIITALPKSMRHLKQLKHLSLNDCYLLKEIPEGIHSCISLEKLEAKNCVSLASFPNVLGDLRSLWYLNLSWTAIEELPSSIYSLLKFWELSIIGCKRLKFLPKLPHSIIKVYAAGCYEMEVIADVSKAFDLWELDLSGCQKLVDVPGVEQLRRLWELKLEGCRSLSNSFKKRIQEADFPCLKHLTIPGCMEES